MVLYKHIIIRWTQWSTYKNDAVFLTKDQKNHQ